MAALRKPAPVPDPLTRPFWDSATARRLIVQRCRACGRRQFYPRGHCTSCWSSDLEWVESSGLGTVYSFTVIHRTHEAGFADDVPYVFALIDLDDGVRLSANVTGGAADGMAVGLPVRVVFRRRGGVALPLFAPVEPQ
jgi:hypothetical protein